MVGLVSVEGQHRQGHGSLKAMHSPLLSFQTPVPVGRGQRGTRDVLVYHCSSCFFETRSLTKHGIGLAVSKSQRSFCLVLPKTLGL